MPTNGQGFDGEAPPVREKCGWASIARAALLIALVAIAGRARGQADPSGIVPGKTTRDEVRRVYGEPLRGSTAEAERFEAASFSEVQVFYGPDGVVRRARLRFAKDLPPDVAVLFFDLRSRPRTEDGSALDRTAAGRMEHYDAEGVHLHVVDGIVRATWLTGPGGVVRATREPAPESRPARPEDAATSRGSEDPRPPPEPDRIEPPRPFPYEPKKPVGAKPPAPPAPPSGPRALLVARAWCEPATLPGGAPALAFRATVRARGLEGQEIACAVVLRTFDGRPIPGAPALADKALSDDAEWPAFTIPVATEALEIPADALLPFVMTFSARSGPVFASLDGEWVPSPHLAAGLSGPLRTLAMGQAEIVSGATPGPGSPPGFSVFTRVEANGLRDREVLAAVHLRDGSGRLVRAAPGAPPHFVGAGGAFASSSRDVALSDAAVWDPFKLFVPYGLLDLAPGRSHAVTLVFGVSSGGISGVQEQECTISLSPR
jgi:hypothetical protein